MGASLDFWILEYRQPEILESPGFGLFLPISNYRVFFPLSFCQGIQFLTRNSGIPSFLESSKKLSGTLEFPWKFPIFWQFQGIGYFSHSIFDPELGFQCRIPSIFGKSLILPKFDTLDINVVILCTFGRIFGFFNPGTHT